MLTTELFLMKSLGWTMSCFDEPNVPMTLGDMLLRSAAARYSCSPAAGTAPAKSCSGSAMVQPRQRAGVPGETVTGMTMKGLVECDAIGRACPCGPQSLRNRGTR